MKKHWFSIFGLILVGLFVFLWNWHSPSWVKMTDQEIETYMKSIEKIPFPPEIKNDTLASLRAWGKSDNGQSVYMLNLIKNYDKVRQYPGAPEFKGTPEESNLLYEKKKPHLSCLNITHIPYTLQGLPRERILSESIQKQMT